MRNEICFVHVFKIFCVLDKVRDPLPIGLEFISRINRFCVAWLSVAIKLLEAAIH